jgi:hypothetical protein
MKNFIIALVFSMLSLHLSAQSIFTYDLSGNRTTRSGAAAGCAFTAAPSSSNSNPTGGSTVNLSSNCSGADCGSVSYNWTISNGGTIASPTAANTTVIVPTAAGTYTYNLAVSKAGCTTVNSQVSVTVPGGSTGGTCNGTITLGGISSCDANGYVTFGWQLNGSGNTEWRWEGSTTWNAGSATWQLPGTNRKTYVRLVSNPSIEGYIQANITGCGQGTLTPCTSGATSSCTFTAAPTTSNSSPAGGSTVTLSSNCSGADCGSVSYNWTTSNGGTIASPTAANTTVTVPTAAGTYTYNLAVSKAGCTTVNSQVSVTVPTGTGGTGCAINKVILTHRGDCCPERLVGSMIQGSNDNTNWTTLYTIQVNGTTSASGPPASQEFTFANTTNYSHVRFVAGPNGYGELREIAFYNGSTKLTGTNFGSSI